MGAEMNKKEALHNRDAERFLLGSLMIDPSQFQIAEGIIEEGDFSIPRHRWIYRAIKEAVAEGEDIDLSILAFRLERMGKEDAGGIAYLGELMSLVPSALNLPQYARLVAEMGQRREMVAVAANIARRAYNLEADPAVSAAEAAEELVRIPRGDLGEDEGVVDRLYEKISHWLNEPLRDGEVRGIPTGFAKLDNLLGGLEPALYIIAGRPSMGKTALSLAIAGNTAGAGIPTAYITLEMTEEQLRERMLCAAARVDRQALRAGRIRGESLSRVFDAMAAAQEMPLRILQGPRAPRRMAAAIRRLTRDGCGLIVVDYLQRADCSGLGDNRHEMLGRACDILQDASLDYGVPVLLLCQLNRRVEERQDKRPLLMDLRESGNIEESADVVLMLYRPDYYSGDGSNIIEVICRKDRLNGKAGKAAELGFGPFANITNPET